MGRMELEVKILNINEEEIIKKIENLGGMATYRCTWSTQIFPSIFSRRSPLQSQRSFRYWHRYRNCILSYRHKM